MANTIVQLHSLPSLGPLTLKLYQRTGGVIVNGAAGDVLAEDADAPGLYAATVAAALSGLYAARVLEDAGGEVIGSYLVDLRDDTGAYDLADPAIAGGVQVTAFSNSALTQLAGVTIRLSQPFRGPGVPLEIVEGDDYAQADGRAIEVTVTGLDAGLDVTGASGHLSLKLGAESITFAATDVSRAGDVVVLQFEPSAAETSNLRVSRNWQYDVQLTLASGRKITPISEAEAYVLASYSA